MEGGKDTMYGSSDIPVNRGDIYWCSLGMPYGSEQGGTRPCVIVQNDVGNRHSPTTIVVPLTTQIKRMIPTHYRFYTDGHCQTACAEQIRTIDKVRLGNKYGRLSDKDLAGVMACVNVATKQI